MQKIEKAREYILQFGKVAIQVQKRWWHSYISILLLTSTVPTYLLAIFDLLLIEFLCRDSTLLFLYGNIFRVEILPFFS